MYQNCCRKCGSVALHTEVKGNNTGLYCDDCGAYVKWLSKDELRAFEYSMREATKEEHESVNKYIQSISKPTGVNLFDNSTIALRLADLTGVSDSYWLNLQKKYDDTICKSIKARSIDAKSVQTRLLTEDEYEKITNPNVNTKEKIDIVVNFFKN